jgi:hypothetical protein
LQQIVESQSELINKLLTNTTTKSTENNKSSETIQFNLSNLSDTEEMALYQNAPNPFNKTTSIRCYIPNAISKAELCIYNMHGEQIKCLTVSERGNVDVQIEAGALASGIYTYLLIGDGKTSEAKNMILTK